ncbi:hypothetical protein [Streptomyces hygroscopicus]|uniref:hypothetical protein n=1 Tax=Streptomyces hygroscopicus TaxID=1912 RepID=UPI002240147A|nr:hypothetical protein [Streptomyces hygroscopicus]
MPQCDPWFPDVQIPLGYGQTGRPPADVEHTVARFKRWRILSEEGGRFRAPI